MFGSRMGGTPALGPLAGSQIAHGGPLLNQKNCDHGQQDRPADDRNAQLFGGGNVQPLARVVVKVPQPAK